MAYNRHISHEIELNDASDLSRTGSLAFGVDLRYEVATNSTGRIHPWQNSSAISGHPDIPCFLLLDDPANKLFLSAGLGAHRIVAMPLPFQAMPPLTICFISQSNLPDFFD
jgi:hypothetical protein